MLTAFQTVVQSAAIHPDWTAEDHAMYLVAEYVGPSTDAIWTTKFQDLIVTCQNWLDSDVLKDAVSIALDYARNVH